MSLEIVKDYSKLLNHAEQRSIHAGHVRRIMASMRAHGFLKARPITCLRESGRLRILDGHHRLEAARTLGLPVWVMVVPSEIPLETLNALNMNWNLGDCINSFIVRGNQEYMKLNSYIVKGLPPSIAVALLMGRTGKSQDGNTKVRNGTFKASSTKNAEAILDFIYEVEPLFPQAKTTYFLTALTMCLRVPEFNLKSLAAKVHSKPDLFRGCTTKEAYLDMIDKAYNHQAHAKIPLGFLAREKGKQISLPKGAKKAAQKSEAA